MLYLQIASPKSSVLNFLDSNSFEVIISIFQRTEKVPDMERLRFLLLSRCLFNSKNKPVCQEHPENLNVHLLLIIRLIFNSTKITFFNIVWDTPSITVTSILYFTSISTFSGGLTKSLSISFSSTPAIFAIVSLDMP